MAIQTKDYRILEMVEQRIKDGWKDRTIHAALKGKFPDMLYETRDDYIRAARATVNVRPLSPEEKAAMHKAVSLDYIRYTGWRMWILTKFGQEVLDMIEGWSVIKMMSRLFASRKYNRRPTLSVPPSPPSRGTL